MESRLQSNEVRIPKTTSATLTITNGILSSSSSISNNNNNPSMTTSSPKRFENFSSKHANNLPDFDFSSPCQYFKSSFARSLSMSAGSNQTKSLDFGINFGLSQTSSIREEPQTPVALGGNNSSSSSPPLPLPRSQHPSMILTNGLSNSHVNGSANHPSNNNSNCSSNNNTKCNSRNVWSTSHKQNLYRRSLDSTEIEVLRLRKECQNLIEENRRLMGLASSIVGGNLVVPGNSPNIEAVILQTQVDTLQWQLKQVEASRQMYRAVMEEVVRFLERCHRNLDSIQNEQIARSKSIHHVYQRNDILSTNNIIDCNNPTTSPRARSSTNLIDVQKTACQSSNNNNNNNNNKLMINDDTTNSLPATSYNNFRDFTWRRSPKRPASAQLATSECDPEKLSQEAFRLLRTAQNLLNTQEPDLTQPKHTIEFQYNNPLLTTSSSSSSTTTTTSTGTATAASSAAVVSSSAPTNTIKSNQSLSLSSSSTNSDSFCLTFSRKMNIRESRLSLRSSTDGSVHSTSSSKNETDEENHSPPICKETTTICNSTTEDESGFSSISSFQEIGLPLNSTMISSPIPPIISSSISDDSGESNIIDTQCIDNNSRNSTLKGSSAAATTTTTTITLATASISSSPLHLTSNNIGLPLNQQQQQQQRKWESAPAVPPRTNLHRFSTLPTDDTPTVLWV